VTSSTDRQPVSRPSINSIVQSLLGSRDGLVPGIQAFPNLDVDRIARDLALEEKGERNGASTIPGPNDRTPDAAELDIRVAIERFVLAAQSSYQQQRDLYEERAQRATLTEGHQVAIEAAGENTLSTLRVLVVDDTNHLHLLNDRARQAETEFRQFTQTHRLARLPRSVPQGKKAFLYIVLAIVVLVETILNGIFFAEGSTAGFAGGVLQAILLALLNLSVASAAARYFLPMLYRRAPASRVVGVMLLAFFVLWLVGFNLWVGHFRDLFALGESSVGLRDIFYQMSTAPLGLRDAKSLVLVALGIAAGIVAFIDVVSLRDPYPGYDDVGTRRDSALSGYAETKSRCIVALKSLRDDAIADMQRALDSLAGFAHELQLVAAGRTRLHRSYVAFLEHAAQSYQLLIRRYREANQRARTEPVPGYFRETIELPEFLARPDLPPLRVAADDRSGDTIARIRHFIVELNQEFEQSVGRYPTLSDLTTIEAPQHATA
jgi:hypothetical protein